MTILDSAKPTTAGSEATSTEPVWRRPLLGGASAAASGLLTLLLLVGVAGSLAPRASVDWGAFFGTGAALWLLLGGGRLAADGMLLAVTPLLGTLALIVIARTVARRAITVAHPLAYAAWFGGYALVTAAAIGITVAGPAKPVWWSLPLPLLVLPGLALALAELPTGRWESVVRRVPRLVRRSVRPAVRTCGVLLVLGMAIVLVAVAVHLGQVARLYGELDAGPLGGVALTFGQLLALPNLGLWVLSLLSGPGFALSEGSVVTLGHSDGGLLPLVPVFGALPDRGGLPWYAWLLYLLPVLAGAYAARRTLAEIPRLAATRTKVGSVAMTVVLISLLLALLDGVAGGSLGDGRLSDVGPSATSMGLALAVALGLGAALVVLRDWRRRRR